jgi:sigma-B regulation protein RsbU (phosphoserine phosphatase)
METVYQNASRFTGKSVPLVPDTQAGVPSAKYMLAPGVSMTENVRRELRTISNAEYAFSVIFKNNPVLHNIYLGTTSGISYRYSSANSYNPSYDPRTRAWFTQAMNTPDQTIWLDTYVDAYGVICVTCARVFRGTDGSPRGVVATDIAFEEMTEKIIGLQIGTGGYAYMLDSKGGIIASGKPDQEMSDEYQYFSAPLEETGWTFHVGIPVSEVVAPAEATKSAIDDITDQTQNYIRTILSSVLMRFIIIFAVSAMLVVAFSYALSLTITRPIEELALGVRQIGSGNLDTKIPVNGKDEIAELGGAFNKMTDDIKEYINNLQKITAEKERVGAELSVASGIQNDMLPSIFPAYSGDERFVIFAKMQPAKEVGGDFYDFFFLDEAQTKIACVIADVSGKGVPAALFMVISKTLLKQRMLHGGSLADVLADVNHELCQNNPHSMFCTMFICVLDLATGEFRYANGGHNAPLIAQGGEPYQFMELKKAIPPGMLTRAKYQEGSLQFAPGDRLYLYTDGVNEAMNLDNKQFTNDALLRSANNALSLEPEAFDGAIRQAVAEWTTGADQSDDITTLAFHFIGAA